MRFIIGVGHGLPAMTPPTGSITLPVTRLTRGKLTFTGRYVLETGPDAKDTLVRVSCLMVTNSSRIDFVKQSIACFQAQTYPGKELIIIHDSQCETLTRYVLGKALSSAARKRELSPGEFLPAMTAFGLFMNGIVRFATSLSDLACAAPLWERARTILSASSENSRMGGRTAVLAGNVEIENVTFRYSPAGPMVLDHLNARIKSGQFAALVGPSGSGKSKLVRTLLGFEPLTSGQILCDGIPRAEMDIFDL